MAVEVGHVIGRRLLCWRHRLARQTLGVRSNIGLITALEGVSPALTGILLCCAGMQHLLWLCGEARRVAMLGMSYVVVLTLSLCSSVLVVLG